MTATAVIDRAPATRLPSPPGDLAIWIFILAELLVFGRLFVAYAFARAGDVALFNHHQQELDQAAGLINTLLLVTGSYFVVRAVAAVRGGSGRACALWLAAGFGTGVLFVAVKFGEYADKFAAGVSLSTNTFYMFYLGLTFFHLMHVLMGMVILAVVAQKAWRGGYSRVEHAGVETGAAYWHMVDLVWLILFPLLYVMR